MKPPDWSIAACRGMDGSIFFADGPKIETDARTDAYKEGRAVCAFCQLRDPCLEYALKTNEAHGLWGGQSPRERLQIKRRRALARRKKAS